MKTIILLVISAVALSAAYPSSHFPAEWHVFKFTHGKEYDHPMEEYYRMRIFLDNKKRIEEHNAKYEKGEVTYKMKMNHFGDLLPHEFKAQMNGLKMSGLSRRQGDIHIASNDPLAESVDWRTKGAVTPVKNQGQCGSCWSFSATGALEGQIFLKKGELVSLSEQNLVDCSRSYGNNGCNGGLMDQAFTYIKDNKGIDTESSYPYEARDGRCRFKKENVGASDVGFKDIPEGNENALADAIAKVGPVAVAIDAGHNSFQFYSEGVYFEPHCSSSQLDHGVLAVGYGTENGQDYWLVKNSWGGSWGDHGYIKMARNKNNHCGIASMASYPLV